MTLRLVQGDLTEPILAVIVPHFNDMVRLERCLEALIAATGVESAEIIVVDNGTPADMTPLHRRFPGVRFVVEAERGAAAARNRGVRESKAPRLFFLDSDCVPAPDWIVCGMRALEDASVVGGSVETFDETPPPRTGAQAYEAVFAFDQRRYVEQLGFSVSANLLTWRSIFETVGPFEPGVSEDMDWCLRARALGYPIRFKKTLRVAHPTRADTVALLGKMRRVQREMFALAVRRPFGRLRWALRIAPMLASPLVHGPRLLVSPRLASWGERRRGLATLCLLRATRAAWMVRQTLGMPL